jgi:large subunit ribosomal protein L23
VAAEHANALSVYNVILRAHVTEKATHLVERGNMYTFLVNKSSTKTEIRAAVEELWGVRVVSVKTINRVGKTRRHKMHEVQGPDTKKAIVFLHSEDRIAFF